MSKENDEARLLLCYKKYEQTAKQVMVVDDITDSNDPAFVSSKLAKHLTKCEESSSSSVADGQARVNQVLAQTITKFLQELDAEISENDAIPSK